MKTILIIEDNREVRENTAEMLSLHHFRTLTAENGRTGFMVAKAEQPDLILCDMMMPETGGKNFLRLARQDKNLQEVPIVFFSAGTPSTIVMNHLRAASQGFLKKPFLEEDLLATIELALYEHSLPK